MPLHTQNAGAMVSSIEQKRSAAESVKVRFNVTTYVQSLGRDSKIDEAAEISGADARFLIGTGKAEVVNAKPANTTTPKPNK